MTLVQLALLTDIPTRALAQIECGLLVLDPASRIRLAGVFGLAPDLLIADQPPAWRSAAALDWTIWLQRAAAPLFAMLSGLLLWVGLWLPVQPAPTSALTQPTALPTILPTALPTHGAVVDRALRRSATATPTRLTARSRATPVVPTPTPLFMLAGDGPHGCPLFVTAGQVVITQGYAEGTHVPTAIWGAIDLALDVDGDGEAEPDATRGQRIVATHGGIAHVYRGSWPGGNYVLVVDEQAGWSTAYAHLDMIAVVDGQTLFDGDPVGTVGSTGMATGPHLHYEVWHRRENVDPTGLIACGR
jgi:hypothetical protein